MINHSIYTERNNCQDCYKCVRRCPVKAIKIEAHSASIIPELCIRCGNCTLVCPAEAKRIRDDVPIVKHLLRNHDNVVAAVAPAWVSEYPHLSEKEFISQLKALGFSKVSEVAIGAEMVSSAVVHYLSQNPSGTHISSCCPSVVNLIAKYYPQHLNKLTPVVSPMEAHARFLKENYGKNIRVVFIGPCIAKKDESSESISFVDAAITFNELSAWLKKEESDTISMEDSAINFFPYKANDGSLYPVDGGMINSLKADIPVLDTNFMTFSGRDTIKNILENMDSFDSGKMQFLELLACQGGCINGPGCENKESISQKRSIVIETNNLDDITKHHLDSQTNISCSWDHFQPLIRCEHTEASINDALNSIGKFKRRDYLNCSGCGYESCRDFAIALIEAKAERSMCVSYMRRVAQNKASVLLQKMPYGVVMCDENLKIIESNVSFARLLGKESLDLFDDIPGLEGADLRSLFEGWKLFDNVLESGLENFEKDIRINDKLCHLSIFSIQQHKILCGILQNLHSPEVRNEEVIRRSKEVIRENLATVQQVAFLLGETASRTETMMNSIIQTHTNTESSDV